MDQDQREVRLLQELYIEDADRAYGKKRQRNFRWRNVNDDEGMFNKPGDSDEEAAELNLDDNISQKLERAEREKYISELEVCVFWIMFVRRGLSGIRPSSPPPMQMKRLMDISVNNDDILWVFQRYIYRPPFKKLHYRRLKDKMNNVIHHTTLVCHSFSYFYSFFTDDLLLGCFCFFLLS